MMDEEEFLQTLLHIAVAFSGQKQMNFTLVFYSLWLHTFPHALRQPIEPTFIFTMAMGLDRFDVRRGLLPSCRAFGLVYCSISILKQRMESWPKSGKGIRAIALRQILTMVQHVWCGQLRTHN